MLLPSIVGAALVVEFHHQSGGPRDCDFFRPSEALAFKVRWFDRKKNAIAWLTCSFQVLDDLMIISWL